LFGCIDDNAGVKKIESEIKGLVASHSTYISSIAVDLLITKIYSTERLIASDDIYMRTDKASIIYGFKIDDGAIRIDNVEGVKTLCVTVLEAERIAVNRENVKIMTNYGSYALEINERNAENNIVRIHKDIDAEINREIAGFEERYRHRNMEIARENLRNFFLALAVKYGLALRLEFSS
jgi:hypothetical protein